MKKNNINTWHYLPEMPEWDKEVLIAIKYSDIPIQAIWHGRWIASYEVRHHMEDGFGNDATIQEYLQSLVYAWRDIPKPPPTPK